MLPPIIIDEIKKRELEERRRRDQQPMVEAPWPHPVRRAPPAEPKEADRGVEIIDVL